MAGETMVVAIAAAATLQGLIVGWNSGKVLVDLIGCTLHHGARRTVSVHVSVCTPLRVLPIVSPSMRITPLIVTAVLKTEMGSYVGMAD